MNFGNWEVNDFGIIGLGKLRRLEISREDLVHKRDNLFYDCLLNIAEMGIVSELNVYEFNAAFIFALSFFNIDIPRELSFSKTFEKQIQMISEKLGDDEDELHLPQGIQH
ncbi:hypothetical protein [Flavobacterium sp.]|jgi:hypothetical protein|uniref:hypothetical protein n=1 Tax=Flavobacterium sp. TaxID=239 RepID=UPI0037BE34E0